MISRVIFLCAVIGLSINNLLPETVQPPKPLKPLTPSQLQAKAKQTSVSKVCKGKRKTKKTKNLCRKWEAYEINT